jgi:heme exporter protein C
MKNKWWKYLTVGILAYVFYFGFVGEVPRREILNESIRNVYFHVPLWFGMIIMLFASVVKSLQYLYKSKIEDDDKAVELVNTSLIFGVLGCLTGALWANFTWGEPWPNDPKLNGVAIGMLIYLAYAVLRNSIEDEQKRARISAVYNVFAFVIFMVLIWILPRLNDSLHPGNGGNPAFGKYDMNNQMRLIFYPAVIGFTLLGVWMAELKLRIRTINRKLENN